MDPNRMDEGFDDLDPSLHQQNHFLNNASTGQSYHSFYNHPQQDPRFVAGPQWNHQASYDTSSGNAYQSLEATYTADNFLSESPYCGIDGFARSHAENSALYNINPDFHELPRYPASTYGNSVGYSGYAPDNDDETSSNRVFETLQRTFCPSDTVAPSALQANETFPGNDLDTNIEPQANHSRRRKSSSTPQSSTYDHDPTTSRSVSVNAFATPAIPASTVDGRFLVKDLSQLALSTNSTILGNTFVAIGRDPIELKTAKTTIPKYVRRYSRNERRALMNDPNTSARAQPPSKRLKLSRSRSRHRRSGSDSSSESDTDNDSEHSSSDEDNLEVEKPSPLPATKPIDPVGIVEYDTIKALYLPNRQASNDQIKKGLIDFGNILKPIRESIKIEAEALKSAEDAKNTILIPNVKARLVEARRKLEVALATAFKTGHGDIIQHLSQNPPVISILSSSLLERVKESDYEGALTSKIIELISRITIDEELLEKSKLDKLLPRLSKKGNERIKQLSQTILSNAAAATKRKADADKAAKVEAPFKQEIKKENPTFNRSLPAAGSKRPRESEGNSQPLKKTGSTQGTPAIGSTGLTKATGIFKNRVNAGSDSKGSQTASAASATAAKPRTHQVVARPTGFFSSLQSASKKPGTSNAAVAAAQKNTTQSATPETPFAVPAPAVPEAKAKPTFSFSEIMANLNKPKEPDTSAKTEAPRQPETESEARKRMRREKLAARGIKGVTFKPDENLVETRLLSPTAEEESDRMDRDDSAVRDVGDVGGEGRMFKKHLDVDAMDVDEDEVGDGTETTIRPFRSPSLVDFHAMRKKAVDNNYTAFGGFSEPDSPERMVQEQRESRIPMEYYIDVSSIPYSPKEPSNPYSGEVSMTLPFGEPNEMTAIRAAELRMSQNPPQQHAPPVTPSIDLSAILSTLRQPAQQQQPPPPQSMEAKPPMTELERIFAQFSNKTPQSASQIQNPQQILAPGGHAGGLPPGMDLRALLAGLPQNQGQVQPQPPVPDPSNTAHLQALLAQLGGAAPSQHASYGYSNVPSQANMYATADQNRNPNWGGRDGQGDYHDRNRNNGDVGYGSKQNFKNNKAPVHWKAKTQQCKYWASGSCKKAERCTFLHE